MVKMFKPETGQKCDADPDQMPAMVNQGWRKWVRADDEVLAPEKKGKKGKTAATDEEDPLS